MSVAVLALWTACTVLTFTFPYLNLYLGAHGTFWLYATICIAGDLAGLEVQALVESALGGWARGPRDRDRYLQHEATLAPDRARIVLVSRPGSVQTEFVIGAPGPDRSVEGGWAPYPVLGCVVNGPGEARETDIGITGGGQGKHMVYLSGITDHHVRDEEMIDHIVRLVEEKAAEIEAAQEAAE